MKNAFYGSLCYEGIRGGAIYVEEGIICYRSKVLTLPEEYQNIRIPFSEIESLDKGRKFIFPAVTVRTISGKSYKFVVFNRKKFLECCTRQVEKVQILHHYVLGSANVDD